MLYDVRLELHYDYKASVHGDRHLVRVAPISIPNAQRVIASSLSFEPRPEQETTFADYFGNLVTTIAYAGRHDHLDVRLSARVQVEDLARPVDLSPTLGGLKQELATLWSVAPDSPQHFLSASPRIPLALEITDYARSSAAGDQSVYATAMDLCLRIHRDFSYDKDATKVDTGPVEAFALKRGVCQDFAHVMIAGLRGLGIPAGYVSGFLRTIPPKGKPRLEGADAMHAWVRVWCGQHSGWLEFDPTNAMLAGPDHITIGHGRDYSDISPIVGVLRTSGGHTAKQSVDVVRVE
ncbi:transglutaminase [Devosia sp. Root413D1]|uniref:transglutaminase family protein n=1 Tax=unclassified Devosia TaxID=196773 RepID=UPI0006F7476C|nr:MULTISPECIES: transglutaminase family protein [unclassified Devosia]KQU97616.1 transglutaminase [Devosia sp. Root105]KQW77513.1 transglutaminase [Devosia sp. Root413D1]